MKVRLPCVGKHNTQDIRNSVLHHLSASVQFYITCEFPTGNLALYSSTLQESGTVLLISALCYNLPRRHKFSANTPTFTTNQSKADNISPTQQCSFVFLVPRDIMLLPNKCQCQQITSTHVNYSATIILWLG